MYIKAPKKDYIRYDSSTAYDILEHFQGNMCKASNHDKVKLKKELFEEWKQPQLLKDIT